ncbi:hypothetical protein HID58_033182, partial [Brassica napus]
ISIRNSSAHINNINTTTDHEIPVYNYSDHINNIHTHNHEIPSHILIHNSSDHINNIHAHIDQESYHHFHTYHVTTASSITTTAWTMVSTAISPRCPPLLPWD